MTGSVNKVILIGNLGRDPAVKSFPDGGKIVELALATSERWTDRNTGEKREKTEWHRVVIKNEHLVKVAENYLRKGSKVYVEGRLETREWADGDGNKRYMTEVVVPTFKGELTLLDGRQTDPDERDPANPTQRLSDQQPSYRDAKAGRSFAEDLNDDIPF